MHRLFAEAIALGVKTVLVVAHISALLRRQELTHLPSAFAVVDMAKNAWLQEYAAVLQSVDPLSYHLPTLHKFDLN